MRDTLGNGAGQMRVAQETPGTRFQGAGKGQREEPKGKRGKRDQTKKKSQEEGAEGYGTKTERIDFGHGMVQPRFQHTPRGRPKSHSVPPLSSVTKSIQSPKVRDVAQNMAHNHSLPTHTPPSSRSKKEKGRRRNKERKDYTPWGVCYHKGGAIRLGPKAGRAPTPL